MKPENETQVTGLCVLGHTVPVGAFGASAVIAWCVNSTTLFVLSSIATAFCSLLLGLHLVLWRLQCRRARMQEQVKGKPNAC